MCQTRPTVETTLESYLDTHFSGITYRWWIPSIHRPLEIHVRLALVQHNNGQAYTDRSIYTRRSSQTKSLSLYFPWSDIFRDGGPSSYSQHTQKAVNHFFIRKNGEKSEFLSIRRFVQVQSSLSVRVAISSLIPIYGSREPSECTQIPYPHVFTVLKSKRADTTRQFEYITDCYVYSATAFLWW